MSVVSDEADRNPDFAHRIESVLGSAVPDKRTMPAPIMREIRRPGRRRPPAVLDPIELAARSERELREALEPLTLDQLRDIVADYGMDQDRLVMKWKTPSRLVERIVETSIRRAHKGDAFRS